jgi:hypothetical protein
MAGVTAAPALPPKGNRMKRLGRYRLIGMAILGAIAAGLIARAEYLNFNDYCYSEGSYLGDQGLIDATIRYEIDHVPANYFSQGGKKYASVEEFHQVNPICCRLEKWGDPNIKTWDFRARIWAHRIIGEYFFVVDLWYRFKDEGQNQFTLAHYLINACGKVGKAGFGGYVNLPTGATRAWEGPGHE